MEKRTSVENIGQNQNSTENKQFAKDHFHSEKMKLNQAELDLRGVMHSPVTLEIPELYRELETAIANSSLVVLETAPTTWKKYSPESIKQIFEALEIKITDNEIKELYEVNFINNPSAIFFEKLQKMAASHGKPLATADPLSDYESLTKLERKDSRIELAKAITLVSSIASLSGTLAARQKISRRTFLKLVAGATAVGLTAGISGLAKEEGGRAENPLGFSLYTMNDYREVSTAEALDQISKGYREKAPVVTIGGDYHLQGIKHYLLNPRERKVKLMSYLPTFGKPPDLKTFKFEGEEWKQQN